MNRAAEINWKPRKSTTFTPMIYVRVHELAKMGLSNTEIRQNLKIPLGLWRKWLSKFPTLRECLESGRAELESTKTIRGTGETFIDYVYKQLPANLQKLYTEIESVMDMPSAGEFIERILNGCGVRIRQHLFLHALVMSSFSIAEASRRVNVSRDTVMRWANSDPKFGELIATMIEIKKDFVEGCLMERIAAGDTAATIFAARSLMADRGYNPATKIAGSTPFGGSAVVDDELLSKLSPAARREMLALMRAGGTPELPAAGTVIDGNTGKIERI